MVKTALYDQQGQLQDEVELDRDIFDDEINEHLIHQAVVAQLAARRSGTASTKTRGEKRGGGRKPWRQKGTGRARHGSIRSPLWVGGGTVFGPKPRSYKKKISRKAKKKALKSALSAKAKEGELVLVDKIEFDKPKTKDMISFLEKMNIDKKVLIITEIKDENVEKSGRNIPGVRIISADTINIYDILNNEQIILAESALPVIEEVVS